MGMDIARDPGVEMQFPKAVPQSLVRYDPPIFAGLEPSSDATQASGDATAKAGKGKGKGDGQAKTSQLDDMINSMLPPREWTEETGTWMQYVSKEAATRLAVITLQVCILLPERGWHS